MKILATTLLILTSVIAVKAQNLVPDPGFEDYDTCPKGLNLGGGLDLAHWFDPTYGTPDYYNVCANSIGGISGVPENQFGYQTLPEGNLGYCGFHVLGNSTRDYKEYIMAQLLTPLVTGKKYQVSIKVSLADRKSNTGTDNLGAYFVTDTLPASWKQTWQVTLNRTPQIKYSKYGCITDTLNWVTLVDTFTADSSYKYIIVGGVTPFQFTNKVRVIQDTTEDMSYYYIDHVSVELYSTTNVRDASISEISVFPNPIKDKATIRMSNYSGDPYSILITDVIGHRIWERKGIMQSEIIFDRESIPAGIYYYQFSIKGRRVRLGKIIIGD